MEDGSVRQNSIRANKGGLLSTRRGAVITAAGVPLLGALFKFAAPYIIWLMVRIIPPCFLNTFLDVRCPLCGGTHCVAALSRGDIRTALYYNPLVITAALYLIVYYVRIVFSCFRKEYRQTRFCRDPTRFGWIVLALSAAFVIVRNLPFYRAVLY